MARELRVLVEPIELLGGLGEPTVEQQRLREADTHPPGGLAVELVAERFPGHRFDALVPSGGEQRVGQLGP
jgi:hypothetical protein